MGAGAVLKKIVPDAGGDTAFASMSAVYEGLSERWQRRCSGLEAVRDFEPFSRPLHEPSPAPASRSCASCEDLCPTGDRVR